MRWYNINCDEKINKETTHDHNTRKAEPKARYELFLIYMFIIRGSGFAYAILLPVCMLDKRCTASAVF